MINLYITAALLDWFIKFPALWAATGFIVGGIGVGVAAVWVFRRYGDQLGKASDKLLDYAKQQLAMMERTLLMQKEHYEAEIAECKAERQQYQDNFRTKRDEWNEESTKMKLVIQELEGRPNVTTLNETMKEVCNQLSAVVTDLRKHEQQTDQRFREFMAKRNK